MQRKGEIVMKKIIVCLLALIITTSSMLSTATASTKESVLLDQIECGKQHPIELRNKFVKSVQSLDRKWYIYTYEAKDVDITANKVISSSKVSIVYDFVNNSVYIKGYTDKGTNAEAELNQIRWFVPRKHRILHNIISINGKDWDGRLIDNYIGDNYVFTSGIRFNSVISSIMLGNYLFDTYNYKFNSVKYSGKRNMIQIKSFNRFYKNITSQDIGLKKIYDFKKTTKFSGDIPVESVTTFKSIKGITNEKDRVIKSYMKETVVLGKDKAAKFIQDMVNPSNKISEEQKDYFLSTTTNRVIDKIKEKLDEAKKTKLEEAASNNEYEEEPEEDLSK
jgi:hypothetical protein